MRRTIALRGLLIFALWLAAPLAWSAAATAVSVDNGTTETAPAAQLTEIDVIGERPGPRLWKVTDGEHELWLLGTLNHVPKRMVWRSSEVDGVLARAQELLEPGPSVSASIGPIGAIKLYFQWRRTQKNPDRQRLATWLTPGVYAHFEALKARFDPNDTEIESLRPTLAALRLYEHAVDAAGLTEHDEAAQAVVKLAKHRGVPIVQAELKVDDPSGALKEVEELSPAVEMGCLESTLKRIDVDLPSMQERARAWAVGDVDQLRALPLPNQREICLTALASAPRIKALVERVQQGWNAEALAALKRNRVSFAMRPIYELLSSDGPLAMFREMGYTVEGP